MPVFPPFEPAAGLLRPGILAGSFPELLLSAMLLLSVLLTPLVVFAALIHWLEQLTQQRLATRFGWKVVLWTGWLGTPLHELSHALMCWVFHHRIDDLSLFEPDPVSGRLGYVRHSYVTGNWYQELGTFFIGLAPLAGGSLALSLLLWLFYPSAIEVGLDVSRSLDDQIGWWHRLGRIDLAVAGEILAAPHWLTARFWLFVYLVLCVGSHMAPSPSDYRGALRGGVLVGGILVLMAIGLAAWGTDTRGLTEGMVGLLGPLFAVLTFVVVLMLIIAVIVWVLTSFFPVRYRIG